MVHETTLGNANTLREEDGVKVVSTPGAPTNAPKVSAQRIEESFEKVEDVRLEIYQRWNVRPNYVAYLKIRDNVAIITDDFLHGLLVRVARTILAWEASE